MALQISTDFVPLHQYNGSPYQHGECNECGKVRSNPCWCVSNFKKDFDKWISANTFLDDIIRKTQSHATERVAYEYFILVEQIASGSFSTVHLVYWLEGPRWIRDDESEHRLRNGSTKCALKKRGSWVTDICDNSDPTQISEQFDSAVEKKHLNLENNQFTHPEIHPLAIYNSELIHFSDNYTPFIDWRQNLNKAIELPFR
ncbi:44057_t:CDS:2 [Gigaspora margarita]|uniref:44057_t:CDS:1 n=1 Tax=Gigaspora margarita TaxID=4874 RepID=A0ABN7V298_GIGMA|nr:44057_t:CDS:2 [Gigaspora margarita]